MEDDITAEQRRIKMKIKSDKKKQEADAVKNLNLPDHLVKTAELAQDKGSSNWLTTLPLEKYGFSLNKSEFHDTLKLYHRPCMLSVALEVHSPPFDTT